MPLRGDTAAAIAGPTGMLRYVTAKFAACCAASFRAWVALDQAAQRNSKRIYSNHRVWFRGLVIPPNSLTPAMPNSSRKANNARSAALSYSASSAVAKRAPSGVIREAAFPNPVPFRAIQFSCAARRRFSLATVRTPLKTRNVTSASTGHMSSGLGPT